jgi:L-2-hydroxyglutarate oxidase LhgO
MQKVNIAIIGGGVIGLSIAASLSKKYTDIYLLEKNKRMAQEISTHNSGVIHSGIHYPPVSLKAKLCVLGNRMIYNLCAENKIAFKRLGKLTVALGEDELPVLKKLYDNGRRNGVEGMQFLSKEEISKMEPGVKALEALYTPTSGIVEQDDLIQYFYSMALRNDVVLSQLTEVTGIKYNGSGYELKGKSVLDNFEFQCDTLINCAGLNSDTIAEMAGIEIDRYGYRLKYYKGDYYRVLGKPPVRMLVYPIPNGPGLGIHLTPDMSGSVKLGPNAYPVSSIDYSQGSNGDEFIKDVSRFVPEIAGRKVEYDSSGIRPKLAGSDKEFRDFIIKHEADKGFPGLINLIGIESPGLTASPAIAQYVSKIYEDEISLRN